MDFKEKLEFLKNHESGYITDALRKLGLSGWIDGVFPVQKGARFAGEVFPVGYSLVAADEKTYSLYEMVDMVPEGSVLVMVGAHGEAVFGGNVYRCCENKGIAAMVCEGRCRDIDGISEGTMPLYCEGSKTRLPGPYLKITKVGVPVAVQGQKIKPGDIMMGDGDGVVFIPKERFDDVFELVLKIAEIEAECEKVLDAKGPVTEIGRLMKIKNSLGH